MSALPTIGFWMIWRWGYSGRKNNVADITVVPGRNTVCTLVWSASGLVRLRALRWLTPSRPPRRPLPPIDNANCQPNISFRHLIFIFCPLPFALCPLPFALCPLPFALCPLPFALCPLPFALCPLPFRLKHPNVASDNKKVARPTWMLVEAQRRLERLCAGALTFLLAEVAAATRRSTVGCAGAGSAEGRSPQRPFARRKHRWQNKR